MTQIIHPDRQSLQTAFHRTMRIVKHTAEGILVSDCKNIIQSVNPAFSRITGYSAQEAIGRTPRLLRSDRHDPSFYVDLWRALLKNRLWKGEIWNRRKNGEIYPQRTVINAVHDEDGRLREYICIFSDNTQEKRQEEALKFLALHDPLTRLPNRALFEERLTFALQQARRNKEKLAVIFIDLDGFKAVNDKKGHALGDLLLRSVAVRLSAAVRASDTAARFGGDEFVVLLMGVRCQTATGAVAERLLENISKPIMLAQQPLQVSASLGISFFPENGKTVLELISTADQAMYAAKRKGHSYAFYEEG